MSCEAMVRLTQLSLVLFAIQLTVLNLPTSSLASGSNGEVSFPYVRVSYGRDNGESDRNMANFLPDLEDARRLSQGTMFQRRRKSFWASFLRQYRPEAQKAWYNIRSKLQLSKEQL